MSTALDFGAALAAAKREAERSYFLELPPELQLCIFPFVDELADGFDHLRLETLHPQELRVLVREGVVREVTTTRGRAAPGGVAGGPHGLARRVLGLLRRVSLSAHGCFTAAVRHPYRGDGDAAPLLR